MTNRERVEKQNAVVMEAMQNRKYSAEEKLDIGFRISIAHAAVANRTADYLGDEFDRVTEEIKQLELQLITKLAEKDELRLLIRLMGNRTGEQSVFRHTMAKERAGEKGGI